MMTRPAGRPKRDEPELDAVSRAQLARVRADVGERTLLRYVRVHLDLLPDRLDRIERAIANADPAEATRVMFDLRTASAVLGARRLAALLSTLEATLGIGMPTGPAQLRVLRAEAAAVAATLQYLLDGDGLGRVETD